MGQKVLIKDYLINSIQEIDLLLEKYPFLYN